MTPGEHHLAAGLGSEANEHPAAADQPRSPMLRASARPCWSRAGSSDGICTSALGQMPECTAESVIRALAPRTFSAVRERLRRERVHTAADLAGLDKDDLKELGLTMVERSKVLSWAKQVTDAAGGMVERFTSDGGIDLNSITSPHARQVSDFGAEGAPGETFLPPPRTSSIDVTLGLGSEEVTSQHLDDVESRADFWFRLVASGGTSYLRGDIEQVEEALRRGGNDGSGTGHVSDLRENVIEKLFDLSPERLKEVYESIDRDSDGRILKEELREGLHRCELHGLDGALEKVLSVVSRGRSSMQLVEFESMLTRLKLAQLLSTPKLQNQAASESLTIIDYNGQKVEERRLSLRDYFFGHRTKEFPMRWAHVRNFDLTLLLALTVKYQLHPLSVEDVVDQAPTKLDRYEGHYFAAIEHLEVAGSPTGFEPVKVRGRHITLFCAGHPHLDTVLTVAQADRSFKHDWPGDAEATGGQVDAWVGRLQKRLRAVRSRVRERRADFLMYEIIDLCADDLRHVTRVYTARLNWLEDRLQKFKLPSEQSKLDWFNEVGLIRLQLAVVSRRLRGLQRILRRLADDPDFSVVLTGYLQDVADHVNEAYEDAGHLAEKCRTLSEAYEHAEDRLQDKVSRENAEVATMQDERMNRMLFVLTILTTIFTPLTFVAGIYGMNFQDMEGHPTIPELLWPEGYRYFWLATIIYLVIGSGVGIWLWRRVHRGRKKDARRVSLSSAATTAFPASGPAYSALAP